MPDHLSIINFRRSSGKTSLAVNLAAAFAQMGKRTLLVDCDPQSNASIWLLGIERWNICNADPESTTCALFDDKASSWKKLVISDAVRDRHKQPLVEGLDLIPASFHLFAVLSERDAQLPHERHVHLNECSQQFQELADGYDCVLFDTPSDAGYATLAAVVLTRNILVSVRPDILSLIGFSHSVELLGGQLASIASHLQASADMEETPAGMPTPQESIDEAPSNDSDDFPTQPDDTSADMPQPVEPSPLPVKALVLNGFPTKEASELPEKRLSRRVQYLKDTGAIDPAALLCPAQIGLSGLVDKARAAHLPVALTDGLEDHDPQLADDFAQLANWLSGSKLAR